MRTPRRTKQSMYYALWHEGEPIYETDDEGNVIYDIMPDGSLIPRKSGETPEGYDEPVAFWNSITGELTEDELQAFGAAAQANAKMTFPKDVFPFKVGTLIWKTSEVGRNPDGTIKEDSADYRVIGIQDTGRHFWKVLLEAVV